MTEFLGALAILLALVFVILAVATITARTLAPKPKDFEADAVALSFPQHNPGLTVAADDYEEPSYDAVSVRPV